MPHELLGRENLALHYCGENVDRVGRDPAMTRFKRRARLQQALWRESQGLPIGTQPTRPKPGPASRPLGSRVEISAAYDLKCNFLSAEARRAVTNRLGHPQKHQTLNTDRLFADLLSSMPMCFNLFGPLSSDLQLASDVVEHWWPEEQARVEDVRFEWSPGRRIPGRFLENSSAFDAALVLSKSASSKGFLGVVLGDT